MIAVVAMEINANFVFGFMPLIKIVDKDRQPIQYSVDKVNMGFLIVPIIQNDKTNTMRASAHGIAFITPMCNVFVMLKDFMICGSQKEIQYMENADAAVTIAYSHIFISRIALNVEPVISFEFSWESIFLLSCSFSK